MGADDGLNILNLSHLDSKKKEPDWMSGLWVKPNAENRRNFAIRVAL